MTIVLIFSLFLTPFEIAFNFPDEKKFGKPVNPEHKVLDFIIDLLFIADLILTFFVAYLNDAFILVDDRKAISRNYL